jgi:23S rRNA (uracil1939-C5)-methyltransferase
VEIKIRDLTDDGEGIGSADGQVIFVPYTVPEDVVKVQIIPQKNASKHKYRHGKLLEIVARSPHRIQPHCIVADKCGGCQWQLVDYPFQLQLKHNKVRETLIRIGKFDPQQIDTVLQVIVPAPQPFGYRNKVAYPLGISQTGAVKAGYFQTKSHKLINLNQCPVQDDRLNIFLKNIKQDIQQQGWTIYKEAEHQGALRHLLFRIGRYTNQVLLTLVSKEKQLPNLYAQAQKWLQQYPNLVGVHLNYNPDRTNVILGAETKCIAGAEFLTEKLLGYAFHLRPDTFFQVYTEQAEQMIQFIIDYLQTVSAQIVVDAYAGIGSIAICIAKLVQQVIAIEIQPQASRQGEHNAQLNEISNIQFLTGKVETVLTELPVPPDTIILDPPRKGCAPQVIEYLQQQLPRHLIYVSCNPATLARDLQMLCAEKKFRLVKVQPFDFFPQTGHVETVCILEMP